MSESHFVCYDFTVEPLNPGCEILIAQLSELGFDSFQENNDLILTTNKNLIRNQGSTMGKGQKLYKRAKRIIPGGNMLLSRCSLRSGPNHVSRSPQSTRMSRENSDHDDTCTCFFRSSISSAYRRNSWQSKVGQLHDSRTATKYAHT